MIEEHLQDQTNFKKISGRQTWRILSFIAVIVLLLIFIVLGYLYYLNQPTSFEGMKTVDIEEGVSVSMVTEKLEAAGIVKSKELLYLILATQFDPTKIKASRYVFDEPLTTYEVADRLIVGDFDTDLTKIIVYEGESRRKIADRLSEEFIWFDSETFLSSTSELEGELFPDTYHVPNEYSTELLVDLLHSAYLNTMEDYKQAIASSTLSQKEVITIASIVEREANDVDSMKYVSGIFLNRLNIGMALQADATIEYILETDLHKLAPGELAQNLKELDDPFNTYLYAGLPPTPIGNPGRDAIEAVIFPYYSEYFYYITGNDGKFHYAETYAQHQRNVIQYLK